MDQLLILFIFLLMLKAIQWPFRSFGNFAIASLGLVGVSFWGYSIYSEGKFNQPIIGQTIKLLGRNPQVKELAGYPLSYSFSLGNRFVEKEGQSYFSFSVRGPKSETNVQMTASTAPARTVYSYGNKNQQIQAIEERIAGHKAKIQRLEQEIKKSGQKKDLLLEKAAQVNKLNASQDELVQAKYQILEKKIKYFVPSKETYSKANDLRAKDSQEIIDPNELLWGINDLVITLPNRTKMIVYPEPKKTQQQKTQIVNRSQYPDTPTVGYFNKKVTIDISQFSKQQIEEYGKQKINFMYSKYNAYRISTMLLFLAGIVSIVAYKKRNALTSIKGSILQEEVKRMINKNTTVMNILKEKNKRQVEFDNLIGGGISNNQFDCVMYLKNLTNGRLQFSGKYLQDSNIYKYQKIILKYRQKEMKRQIDLLK